MARVSRLRLGSVSGRGGEETVAAHGGARIELARLRRDASGLARRRSECARELGEAVYAKNTTATKELKERMKEIDDELATKEAQMATVTIDAQERVGKAKLQVQTTDPGRGAWCPGRRRSGDVPGPVPVPEPFPPPDEGQPPEPAQELPERSAPGRG